MAEKAVRDGNAQAEDRMNATVLCVGKMKEKPYREMADEYLKRLSRFGRIRETEVPDLPEKPGVDENQIRRREGERLLEKIHGGDYVIALTLEGKQMDSESFARHLEDLQVRGRVGSAVIETLRTQGALEGLSETNQISMF